jgi:hypothetical protein
MVLATTWAMAGLWAIWLFNMEEWKAPLCLRVYVYT